MPVDFVIHDFIVADRAEVKAMLFTEYNEEKFLEKQWQDGDRNGWRRGVAESADLSSWLRENGRDAEAKRIGRDPALFDRLFDEYSRAQMVEE